jgi:hypothetical protein
MATTTVPIGTMICRNSSRCRGHRELRRTYRRASDDRNIPARKGGRGLRADDERQGRISRRFNDVMLALVFTVMLASQPTMDEVSFLGNNL